jgi:hypothetical protein
MTRQDRREPVGDRPHDAEVPLTEAVLAALPGPRWIWLLAWALVAPLRPTLLFVVLGFDISGSRHATLAEIFLVQAVFGYVVLVSLLGAALLVRTVHREEPAIERLANRATPSAFRGLVDRRAPLALTLLVVAISTPSTNASYGLAAAIVDLPLLAVMTLPIMTFVWTYVVVLAGAARLGGEALTLDAFPEDRALGVGPIGSVAFTGLWLVFAAAIPALLATGRDPSTFYLTAAIVLGSVALFVLSLVRLHGRMQAAKLRYLALTRALVAEAYAPVRNEPRLATVAQQAATLGAAQALADRAERILVWPVDERAVAFIGVVVTGVLTSVIVRLIFAAAGL